MLRIADGELDITDDLVVYWQGKPFTGIAYEHGARKALGEIEYKNGIQHGFTRTWSESGQLISEKYYEYNILIHKKEWNEKGEIVREFQLTSEHDSYSRWQYFKRTQGDNPDPHAGIVPNIPPEELFDTNSDLDT